jgi:hypothetical protein
MAPSQRHRHGRSQHVHKIASHFLSSIHPQCPIHEQHQATPIAVEFTKAQAYHHSPVESFIQDNPMPIAYVPVRDTIDDGFGLE